MISIGGKVNNMDIKRVDYQIIAIDELVESTEMLLKNGRENSILVFKSPTGSGKTIMTAKYIQRVINEFEDDICFVWVSVGKGNLHIQSQKKLDKIFEGSPKVSLLVDEFFGSRKEIEKNEVVVVNWEAINNKDNEGNYTNTVMRDGEKTNFRQVLANTREIGRKIILIIDESHVGATTERANELRDEIKASIILEMSATPKFQPHISEVKRGLAGWVEVFIQDVIDEEMIKKQLIINEGLQDQQERTIDRNLLESAYNKREELKKLYGNEESNVNPLVIIQLPNAEEGIDKKDSIIEYFKEKNITKDNKKLAIWLNEEKFNLDNISDNTNTVEFLLFKQAIDTGWDCPRAQILLKFRETHSMIFERQTLGRILRMPEQHFYINDIINKAYVYTDYVGNVLNVIDEEFDFPRGNIRPIPINKQDDYKSIEVLSENVVYRKKDLIRELAKEAFNQLIQELNLKSGLYDKNKSILKSKGFIFDTAKLTENIIGEIKIDTDELLSDVNEFYGTETNVEIDEERAEQLFRRILRKQSTSLGNKRQVMFEVLRDSIYEFFFNYVLSFVEYEDLINRIQKLFVLNYNYKDNNFFNKLIIDVIDKYKNLKEDDLIDTFVYSNPNFNLPNKININPETHEQVNTEKYYYQVCYLQKGRSKPEKAFEQYIVKNADKIEYWCKNGDSGSENFSVAYELEDLTRGFFPDYIIKFADGRIGIFDTKDKNDDSDETTAKAERLQIYIQEQNSKGKNLIGGILANYGTEQEIYIKINKKPKYTLNSDDWEDLDDIF